MNLRQRIFSGSAWIIGGALFNQGLQMASVVVLGRMLAPADFGVMALALFFVNFIRKFEELGFGKALVQQRKGGPTDLDSVFWYSLGMGAILCVILEVGAGLIGRMSSRPEVIPALRLLAFVFVGDTLKTVPYAILQKRQQFGRIAWVNISGGISYGGVAVPLALSGAGVYSLIWGFLVSSAAVAVTSFLASRWLPGTRVSWTSAKKLLAFGIHLTGAGFMSYFANNIERFFLGRYLGTVALGTYHFASRLINIPRTTVSQNVAKVLFPVFSDIQDDNIKLKRAMRDMIGGLALLAAPIFALLAVVADIWIPLVFSEKWIIAVTPFRILALSGLLATIGAPIGSVYLAKGKSVYSLVINGTVMVLALAIYPFASRWGLYAVCWGAVVFRICNFIVNSYFSVYAIHMRYVEVIKRLTGPLACGVVVGAAAWGARTGAERFTENPIVLLLAAAAGAAALFGLYFKVFADDIPFRGYARPEGGNA